MKTNIRALRQRPVVVVVIVVGLLMCSYLINTTKFVIQDVHKTEARAAEVEFSNLQRNQHPATELDVDPIPDVTTLEAMSIPQLAEFFYGYIGSVQATCSRRKRMGKIWDGGWDVCEDPRYRADPKNCLVYSFGINNDFTFDDDMEKYGCEVHSYDPSMAVNDHVRGQKVHFHKMGVSWENSNKTGGWRLHTFGTHREINHHQTSQRKVDILKMDVEGAELQSLLKALDEGSLRDVDQLFFEIHVYVIIKDRKGDPKKEYLISMLELLRRLYREGFRLYYTNRNVAPVNQYRSILDGIMRTRCHELYMVRVHQH